MSFLFPPPPVPAVPVEGGGAFPVRRIWCVGHNYADHVQEMGGTPGREDPFFFAKPADALVAPGAEIPYPPRTADFHWEVELVVAIGGAGADVPADAARGLVFGYAAGIDLTRRDLQAAAKAAGKPWDLAKGFDRSAPVGMLRRAAEAGDIDRAGIRLTVNGALRQESSIAHLIWSVPELVATLSTYVALRPGDLIFTGTPKGVGPIGRGDRLVAEVDGLAALSVRVV